MGRSISLAAYMALARRAPRSKLTLPADRPKGELIWAHSTSRDTSEALCQLAQRLAILRPETSMLLTGSDEKCQPARPYPNITWQLPPDEAIDDIQRFLAHWRPDICLWTGGDLRPALIERAARENVPLYLIGGQEAGFDDSRWRWFPELAKHCLKNFAMISVADEATARKLARLGHPRNEIEIMGPLQRGTAALTCDETARSELAQLTVGRPVWLAAMAQLREVPILSQAHRHALRGAHRLLLVLVPDDPEQGDEIAQLLDDEDWRFVRWSNGDLPDENTQIILADTRGEMGLWYQLAPITFMASSLLNGLDGHNPYEPAALGSAVLYGPNISKYLSSYSRLASAGAARIVKDAASLSTALGQLIAPDQTATMAHAAWDVVSEGAEVTDRVLDLIQDTLDLTRST